VIQALRLLASKEAISVDQAQSLMKACLHDQTTPEQIGAMLGLLHLRAPTAELLTGFAKELAQHRLNLEISPLLRRQLVDVCGTGGDAKNGISTFNVSTTVAFLVNACGVPVAKHGNRAISSASGSFDVLDALRVPFCHDAQSAECAIKDNGMAFLFAPSFQPALKTIGPIRRTVGLRTLFNALGPILNPVDVKRQVIGVYSTDLLQPMAEALRLLGTEHALIVHGEDGLDEITLGGSTEIMELKNGEIRRSTVHPHDFGLSLELPTSLRGGCPVTNAKITESILAGEISARADLVCLNTAAALLVGGKVETLRAGFDLARNAQRKGEGMVILNRERNRPSHQLNQVKASRTRAAR